MPNARNYVHAGYWQLIEYRAPIQVCYIQITQGNAYGLAIGHAWIGRELCFDCIDGVEGMSIAMQLLSMQAASLMTMIAIEMRASDQDC